MKKCDLDVHKKEQASGREFSCSQLVKYLSYLDQKTSSFKKICRQLNVSDASRRERIRHDELFERYDKTIYDKNRLN